MNILIFEDEEFNFDLLRDMLLNINPDNKIFGPLASVTEGRAFFASTDVHFDLIIADIHLNDGLSFYALTEAPKDTPIIFTTAYEEYALKAFDFNSLSYLLKPIDESELKDAITKAQERLKTDEQRDLLMKQMAEDLNYRRRVIAKTYNGERIINMNEVCYFVSRQKCTFAVLDDHTIFPIGISISTLAEQLNPKEFVHVNRQYIVSIKAIKCFENNINGKETIILHGDDSPRISVSRAKKAFIHQTVNF